MEFLYYKYAYWVSYGTGNTRPVPYVLGTGSSPTNNFKKMILNITNVKSSVDY